MVSNFTQPTEIYSVAHQFNPSLFKRCLQTKNAVKFILFKIKCIYLYIYFINIINFTDSKF